MSIQDEYLEQVARDYLKNNNSFTKFVKQTGLPLIDQLTIQQKAWAAVINNGAAVFVLEKIPKSKADAKTLYEINEDMKNCFDKSNLRKILNFLVDVEFTTKIKDKSNVLYYRTHIGQHFVENAPQIYFHKVGEQAEDIQNKDTVIRKQAAEIKNLKEEIKILREGRL
jgi:hypothetical protein